MALSMATFLISVGLPGYLLSMAVRAHGIATPFEGSSSDCYSVSFLLRGYYVV